MKTKQFIIDRFLLAAFVITAQHTYAQVEMGIRAGFNLSNISMSSDDADFESDYDNRQLNPGFHAGVTFDIPVADEFYVQPGALFSTKGYRRNVSIEGIEYKDRVTPYYLEVPVNFLYKPALGAGNLLLGVGPYMAYGLGGRWRDELKESGTGDISSDGKLEFVSDWDDESSNNDTQVYGKPFDFGANLLAGYEFSNRFSAQLNAQLGMANIAPKSGGEMTDNDKIKNVGFGVSVGYKF